MDDPERPVTWDDIIFRPDEASRILEERAKSRPPRSPMRSTPGGPHDVLALFDTSGPIRMRWRDLPPIVRRLCVSLPPVGLILASLGVTGDLRGWWDGLGFLTNLFSSTVSLMFALPFALVVVDRLSTLNGQVAAVRDVATAVRQETNRVVRASNDVRAMLEAMVTYLDEALVQDGPGRGQGGELPEVGDAQRIGLEMKNAAERWRDTVPTINNRIVDVGHQPIDEASIDDVEEAARQAHHAVRAYCDASESADPAARVSAKRKIEAIRESFSFPTLTFFKQVSPLYYGLSQ